jgi:hypothetical protein
MTPLSLSELTHAGVAVTVADGRLRLSAPTDRLTPDLRERIAANRDELVAALTMRVRLVALAADEGLPNDLVHGLTDDDVAACVGESDDTMRAYLRAVQRGRVMDAESVPEEYTRAARCSGCGPVWLWVGAPAEVAACPWCIRRRAGRRFPVPSRARA